MHYFDLDLIPVGSIHMAIPVALPFVPRIGDLITTTPASAAVGGNRDFEVVQIYAQEPTEPGKQGRIQVLVRDITIPESFSQPQR